MGEAHRVRGVSALWVGGVRIGFLPANFDDHSDHPDAISEKLTR